MRLVDWQSNLAQVMREAQTLPFDWGYHDCVTFAAACVQAVTGVDPIQSLRLDWSSERQALRVLSNGGGLVEMVRARFGDPLESKLLAKPGDIGVCKQEERPALCICGGVNWHMPGADGLVTLSADQVLFAWSCEVA